MRLSRVGQVALLLLLASCAAIEPRHQDAAVLLPVIETKIIAAIGAEGDDLVLRISHPDGSGPFPLIVFSHGAGCAEASYRPVIDNWVSHGYVVIEPTHPDSTTFGATDFSRMREYADTRIDAMSEVLDGLDVIEARVPGLAGKIDRDHVAAAGHSMGAATAMVAAGLEAKDKSGALTHHSDRRFDAAVLLGGPGILPTTPEESWRHYATPTLVTTGTNDVTQTNKNKPEGWRWRLGAFELTPPGDKYALVVDGQDHFMGGLICGSNIENPRPDEDALVLVNEVTVAFLDAYLKGDDKARKFLADNTIHKTNPRADLMSR